MQRIHDIYRPMEERKRDFKEVERILSDAELREQTSRCMNCGQPFCHAYACPLGNLVPDQNRAVSQGDWKRAYALLSANSDFPSSPRADAAHCRRVRPGAQRLLRRRLRERRVASGPRPCERKESAT